MNKKTLLLAGLALGCSMAVAGVGVAVGASRTVETKADSEATFTIGWGTADGDTGTYQNFTETSGTATVETGRTITFASAKNSSNNNPAYNSSNKELRLYYHSSGKGGSVSFDFSNFGYTVTAVTMITSTQPNVNYSVDGGTAASMSQSGTTYTVSDISATSSFSIQNVNTSNTQLRIKTVEFTYIVSGTLDKRFDITGVTSSGLYLNGDTYDIGYEAVGFDSAPTITDVVWTVPSGAGSIADGKWTAGPAAMESVTLGLDLKADGDDYHAEVTTKIDAVKAFKKNSPNTKFNAGDVFTVTSNFILEYEYAANGSVSPSDAGISYRLENSGGTKVKDLVLDETVLTVEDSGLMVDATYRGKDLYERYTITVIDVFNNTSGAYYLVTDASELADGDHVTFFGYYKKDSTVKSFVPTSFQTKNVLGHTVALDNGAIDCDQEFSILDFKLKDTKSELAGSFAFEVTNYAEKLGEYLYAAHSGENQLKTQESIDDNARFVISIDGETSVASIAATESTNRNTMSANGSGTNTLFSCYGSVQGNNSLYLYKWVSNTDKLDEFAADKLKMAQYVGDNTYSEERCTANYAAAKAAFNELTASQRSLFVAQSGEGKAYHDAYLRLTAWATANGEELGGTNNVLAAKAASMSIFGSDNNDSTMLIALAVVGTGALAAGGFMLAARKRRKEF